MGRIALLKQWMHRLLWLFPLYALSIQARNTRFLVHIDGFQQLLGISMDRRSVHVAAVIIGIILLRYGL